MKTPRFWQSSNLISAALLPASLLYRIGAWMDRTFTKPRRAPVPVISVGNVTAGGAGKTPTTLALVPMLQALGHVPHILTRGYGGAALTAHRVRPGDDVRVVGDEALLLANAAPTWVGRDRVAAAKVAAHAGATVLICDDALQHHALHKDISLLVIDGPYGVGNGWLLPAGPLREPLASALARVDAVIMIGDDAQQLGADLSRPVLRATLKPTSDSNFLRGRPWFAFAGIGRPEKFYVTLRELGATLAGTRDFPDHHAYSERDVAALIADASTHSAALITTQKDAVKLPPALSSNIQILPVELAFENAAALQQLLADKLAKQGAS